MNWETTLDTIQDEKCILFLGPEVFTSSENEKLEDQLIRYLAVEKDTNTQAYRDGLFFFKSGQKKTDAYYEIRRFYQQSFPKTEAILEKIAQIPFHFVINLTPDKKLVEAFEKQHFNYKEDFYFKRNPDSRDTRIPTASSPLIYNLLGSIEKQNSLVLTHDDLFDYFESILQEKSMPVKLKSHIMQSKNMVFLGIPFDRWYLQLLLRVFQLHKDEEFLKFAANQSMTEEIKTLFKDQFQINFIPQKIDVFVEEIHRRCEERGILRKSSGEKEQQSPLSKIKNLIASSDLESAFDAFAEFLEKLGEAADDLMDEMIMLKSRFIRLQKRVNRGVIDNRESFMKENQITESLLNLVREANEM